MVVQIPPLHSLIWSFVSGLDPARPLVADYGSRLFRLGREDAYVVQVVHTNAGFLGESGQIGHADFCVNGGRMQPGCKGHLMRVARCSHFMSACYFSASVSKRLRIVGVPCDSSCPKQDRWGIRPGGRPLKLGDDVPDSLVFNYLVTMYILMHVARGMYCVSLDHQQNCPFD
ncbi:unnamed protein product [Danaus chrysippus]|uniref:(African queen) hypothetical protein n=1 Tax=Danaus chrysippus TaxID=151541 RepID=A0A8J2R286_9NEOP|nr:unnamed protein product [Danaus chrysippus]